MSLTVIPINATDIKAWQITPDTALDVEEALTTVAPLGWRGDVGDYQQPNSNTLVWTVTLSRSGFANLVGYENDWIVFDGLNVTVCNTNMFVSKYTTNVDLIWSAVVTATPLSGGQVSLEFAPPTSPNGPFTYTVSATDVTATTTADLDGTVSIGNGQVTFAADGLIAGDNYTFTVTCSTQYSQSASSAASNQITAVA